MTVRPARPADLAAVARLEAETFGEAVYPAFFFRQALDAWGELLVVAETSGEVAGYALAAPGLAPGEAWILAVAVAEAARGRGMATALTEAVLVTLRGAGYRSVRLTVHPANAAARRLYERLGFAVEAEEADYFGPGEPRVRMRRVP